MPNSSHTVTAPAVAIAATTLVNQLISRLSENGLLKKEDVAEIFRSAIELNQQSKTVTNQAAAHLLEQMQVLDGQVLPPRL
jgi:hypothetical protein